MSKQWKVKENTKLKKIVNSFPILAIFISFFSTLHWRELGEEDEVKYIIKLI